MSNNKDLIFDDYDICKSFKGILAIEPELGADMFFEREGKCPGQIGRSRGKGLKEEFKDLQGHFESATIREIDNMHLLSKKRRVELVKLFTKRYKGYFTLGASKYASGGVHFHIFAQNDSANQLNIFRRCSLSNLDNNLQATLLYNLFHKKKIYGRYRGNGNWSPSRNGEDNLGGGTGYLGHIKNDYGPAIEFRCNNVFDVRLYGYYTAITMLSLMGVVLPKVILNETVLYNVKQGLIESKNYNKRDKYGRVHVESYTSPLTITDEKNFDLKTFKENLGKMLFVLSLNGLVEARKALEEYILENIGYKIKSVPMDCTSGVALPKDTVDGYSIILNGVKLFFLDKKGIKEIFRKSNIGLTTTTADGIIKLSTNTLTKVTLIKQEPNEEPTE